MNFVCAICIDAFGTELEVVSASCGHCFHRKCIGKWIEQSPSCPSCMKLVNVKELIKLFLEVDQDQLNINEILNTNDELMEELRVEREKIALMKMEIDKYKTELSEQKAEIILLGTEKLANEIRIEKLERSNEELKATIEEENKSSKFNRDGVEILSATIDESSTDSYETSTDSSVILVEEDDQF